MQYQAVDHIDIIKNVAYYGYREGWDSNILLSRYKEIFDDFSEASLDINLLHRAIQVFGDSTDIIKLVWITKRYYTLEKISDELDNMMTTFQMDPNYCNKGDCNEQ